MRSIRWMLMILTGLFIAGCGAEQVQMPSVPDARTEALAAPLPVTSALPTATSLPTPAPTATVLPTM
ncbi:hypothetical protein [Roseiflexus sp.]|uniref:hypothetical protein n=1 Tax=Roseiflexus sp. TaxID=2562120 RepID=UPI0021DC65B6|nr:hypothetical protein [Roseiflexus sp.]GIW03187.1 MAG: hypothetical protein KatS3mg058_4590 [Roseiflexus sp.]